LESFRTDSSLDISISDKNDTTKNRNHRMDDLLEDSGTVLSISHLDISADSNFTASDEHALLLNAK
jgi:hypothetical protein